MDLGCSTLACTLESYPTLASAFSKISSLGFTAVDIALFHNWQHVNPSEIANHTKAWASRTGESLQQHELKAISINCGMSVSILDDTSTSRAQHETEIKAVLALARSIGCANLTINPGQLATDQNLDSALSALRERLKRYAGLAHEVSVSLSLEGHEGSILEDPHVATEFIDGVWPEVGYTFDPSHMIMQGHDPFAYIDLLNTSYHAHVRNAAKNAMQATMSEGSLDVEQLFRWLNETGYNGNIGIEYFKDFDADFANAMAIKATWDSLL